MKLIVFGATGRTGALVVSQALSLGHDVTAVVRSPAKLQGSAAHVVQADVTDPQALGEVLPGHDAAISALGASGNKSAGIASAATRAILTAGCPRFIAVSAVPVDPTPNGEPFLVRRVVTPLLRTVLRDVYADLERMEALISASDGDWTIVRPPRLTNKPLTERYRRTIGHNVPNSSAISRADLAHALIGMINDPATVRQVVGVSY
ncbi:NAD(P)H-binding protein [Actinocrispum sp. NPDC049592]|uniref:NAD(P)-dependent oxidoreductase n=1 Tax=Actinocrispum sp. NPDC049592 TaxID=3154835 RepID=UPI00342041DA